MAEIGHNGGPSLTGGTGWHRFVWQKARADLLPTLPIEVVRNRVKRAAELGLPYKTYASVRAQTGHDLIGFLFSNNALRLLKSDPLPADRSQVLQRINADRTALVHRPMDPTRVAGLAELDAAYIAPKLMGSWAGARDHLKSIVRDRGGAGDRFMLIGEGDLEHEWVAAGGLAGFVSGDTYFAGASL
mgnify:CR=1 FL=1